MDDFVIRKAVAAEQKALEELERRAGLANPGDREAILAHPEIIEVPLEQIAAGDVFLLETKGAIAGFAGGAVDAVMMRIVEIVYALPFALAGIPFGALADRVTRTRMVAILVIIWSGQSGTISPVPLNMTITSSLIAASPITR